MRFVMCGAGAIGGVLGGQLARAGFEVVLIDTALEHVQAINAHGLHLKGVLGDYRLHIPAVTQAHEVDFRPDDVVLLTVKSFHCEAAVAALRQATALELPIFCAQNGIANEGVAGRYFQHVHGMLILIGAKRLVPGEVVHTGHGPVGLGTYPAGLTQIAQDVAAALDATDLPVYTTTRIGPAKWYKLLLNLNSATMALTGLASQEGSWSLEARGWIADVWEEGCRVLQAAGLTCEAPPGMGTIADHIRQLRADTRAAEVPVPAGLQGRASLWQDLYHRRGESEAGHLNGEIVRLGSQYGVPTPYNSLLLTLVQPMAAARELPGQYTIQQLRACLRDEKRRWKLSML